MALKNKIILVTGGTGFIGAAVVNKLLAEGYFVNIIFHPKDDTWRINDLSRCKIFKLDLRNFSETERIIKAINPEIIFHIAGIITPKRDKESVHKLYSINLDITRNLILALDDIEYELFINTGSGNEYGNNIPPFNEAVYEKPRTPYGTSKLAATSFCNMIAESLEKPIVTVRPFLIYGPTQILTALIPSLIFSAIEKRNISLSPCEQTRDFIFIDDVADVYLKLAKNADRVKSMGIFNIGSGKETQLIKVVNLITKRFHNAPFFVGKVPYRLGETMKYYSSIQKINELINWSPQWSIKDGINKTIDWWINNRDIWIKFKDLWV